MDPGPEPEPEEVEQHRSPRTRVGNLWGLALRSRSSRLRKDSMQSSTTTTSDSHGSGAPLFDRHRSISPPPPPNRTETSPAPTLKAEELPATPNRIFRFFRSSSPNEGSSPLPSPKDTPGFPRVLSLNTGTNIVEEGENIRHRSLSISGTLTRSTSEPRRSFSAPHAGSPPRRSTTPVPPIQRLSMTLPSSNTPNNASTPPGATPVPQPATKNWFLQLLSQLDSPAASGSIEPPPPLPSRRRKGNVECLSYRTLDDRDMLRLDGRSDHRPVIGVYAIYV